MSEEQNPLVGSVLVDKKWVTSPEAEKAYTYLPKEYLYPTLTELDQIDNEEKQLIVKIFDPQSRWAWYITGIDDYSPTLLYGYVKSGIDPLFDRWGFFDLNELASISKDSPNPLRLPLERDIHWKPKTWKEALDKGEFE